MPEWVGGGVSWTPREVAPDPSLDPLLDDPASMVVWIENMDKIEVKSSPKFCTDRESDAFAQQ